MTEASSSIHLIVPKEAMRLRLDQFLARELPMFSRSRLQQLIRQQLVTLNGSPARPRDPVRSGDRIEVNEPAPEKIDHQPEPIPLDVLYEDEDLIVINKPSGLVVHPGAGQREHTLVNALLHHFPKLSGIGGKERPGIVHRLDKETSGCLVVAKTDVAHHGLSGQFAARTIEKIYLGKCYTLGNRASHIRGRANGRISRQRHRMILKTRLSRFHRSFLLCAKHN